MACNESDTAVMQNILQTVIPNKRTVTGYVSLVVTEPSQQTISVLGTDRLGHSFKFPTNAQTLQAEMLRAMDHQYLVFIIYTVQKGENMIESIHTARHGA